MCGEGGLCLFVRRKSEQVKPSSSIEQNNWKIETQQLMEMNKRKQLKNGGDEAVHSCFPSEAFP